MVEQNQQFEGFTVRGSGVTKIYEPNHPEYVKAKADAKEIKEAFVATPFEILDGLSGEVAEMPIASRFSETRLRRENIMQSGFDVLGHLTEKEAKREQLQRDLDAVRRDLVFLACRLETIKMDMEATKLE